MNSVRSLASGTKVALHPEGEWQWGTGVPSEVTVTAEVGNVHVGSRPLIGDEDIVRAITKSFPGRRYRHDPSAVEEGTIRDGQVDVDEATISKVVSIGGQRGVTERTTGTFVVNAGKASSVPGSPPIRDVVRIHRGRWSVRDPAQGICAETGGVGRAAPDESRGEEPAPGESVTIRLAMAIDDGPLGGLKGVHEVRIPIGESRAGVQSHVAWFPTEWQGRVLAPIPVGSRTAPCMVKERGPERTRVWFGGSGKTALLKHLGGRTSGAVGGPLCIMLMLPDGRSPVAFVGWNGVGESEAVRLTRRWCAERGRETGAFIGDFITPCIDYSFEVEVDAKGKGEIRGRHNRFPSYRIVEIGLQGGTRTVYEHSHASEWWSPLGLDLRPLVQLPDIGEVGWVRMTKPLGVRR